MLQHLCGVSGPHDVFCAAQTVTIVSFALWGAWVDLPGREWLHHYRNGFFDSFSAEIVEAFDHTSR